MSTSRILSQRFSPSLSMESLEAVSSDFLSLPPEPPDLPSLSMESLEAVSSAFLPLPPEPPHPDLDVMLLVDPPLPPVPPDPPPILVDAGVLLLMNLLLYEVELSSSFTTKRETVAIEISVTKVLGFLTADCKLAFHHYSSLQVLEDWTSKVEILAGVICLYAVFSISEQLFGVHLPTVMFSSQSKYILHWKPWSQVVGPIFPCSRSSQGSGLSMWSGQFVPQQSNYWKTYLANETWIMSSTQSVKAGTLQKVPHSTLSSGYLNLQILADSIVLFFALRSGLDLIEITGSSLLETLSLSSFRYHVFIIYAKPSV
ncbi:unnamed protein product [Eruca vesicaria subsp. sativa]|uniref:Uncharacterized protein n=1 Tax=Eruca vesicaria subsp. sativa TaxID=29727 RepID=A0ABC8M7C7_ERUVS|nr:unnamed protein product [Eruca vesicaria subsp. sativa]